MVPLPTIALCPLPSPLPDALLGLGGGAAEEALAAGLAITGGGGGGGGGGADWLQPIAAAHLSQYGYGIHFSDEKRISSNPQLKNFSRFTVPSLSLSLSVSLRH